MEKVINGIIIFLLIGVFASNVSGLEQVFNLLGVIINFPAAFVKGIIQLLITVVEALL